MRKWSVMLVIFVAVSFPGFAHPDEGRRGKMPLPLMEEVVVTSGRIKEKKKEITSNVVVINEEEIQDSSAKDLGDLLAEKGIGHIHKYPGALTAIGIRGFRTETHGNDLQGHVLVLLNGRRAGTGNVAKILTKNIERVEIIRGPASVQYGSAAMGGIVNIITRRGKGRPTMFLEGVYGSFDHREGSIGFAGEHKGFDFSGSMTVDRRDEYKTGGNQKYLNTGLDETNLNWNLGAGNDSGHHISLIFNNYTLNHTGNPGYLSANDTDDYAKKSNRSVDLVYDGKTRNELLIWKLRFFRGRDTDTWIDPVRSNPDGWDDGIPSERNTDQKGAQAQISMNQENSLITVGFDWVDYEIETTWTPQKTDYENPSYFLLAKTKLFDKRFIVSGGLRYDEYEVEVVKPSGNTVDDDNLSPRFGLAYLLTDYTKVRANYGEAFLMPAADQLAADYVVWGRRTLGNPGLKPEKSRTYEGGFDLSYHSLEASLTYFYTDYRDKIEATTGSEGERTWENKGKATIEGLEGDFNYDVGELFGWDFRLQPYASFVWLTKFKDKDAHEDLNYVSDLQISYGITLSEFQGITANLNMTYTGKQNIQDWESGIWPAPVIKKGGFTVANFTISKRFLQFRERGGLTLRGEIQNLFDRDYEYVKGYPMPGRSFFLGVRYDF